MHTVPSPPITPLIILARVLRARQIMTQAMHACGPLRCTLVVVGILGVMGHHNTIF